jgi:uncharacterized phage infection (PIP) family protein YhgE
MAGLEELHQSLTAAQAGIANGQASLGQAKELFEEAQRVIRQAQGQAEPWLPSQLAQAIQQIDEQVGKLANASELLTGYQSRL